MWSAGWSWGRWPPLRTWRKPSPCTLWPESIPPAPPRSPSPPPSPAHTQSMTVCAFSRKRMPCFLILSYLIHVSHPSARLSASISSTSLHISSIIPPSIHSPVQTSRESSCDYIRWVLNVAVHFFTLTASRWDPSGSSELCASWSELWHTWWNSRCLENLNPLDQSCITYSCFLFWL